MRSNSKYMIISTIVNKLFTFSFMICFYLLISTQCSPNRKSECSDPPSIIPEGVTYKQIFTNGLEADFFYKVSNKPQKAVILLGGSDGGSWPSY